MTETVIETVALISGGKDSFFSLIHSNANGFRVVALANLYPPYSLTTGGNEDLNSFMYQTVGHTVLPQYSIILGIPLYRAAITGRAVNQDLSYYHSRPEEDETEDLYKLLKSIKELHPNLKAVCSGAILSSYQRTRVENVCTRLGLISVAWLWQRKQEMILREMADIGLDARIIKVASLGLDESWLGKPVADYKTRMALINIKRRWGGNVAGEGGEFETLTFGCRGWNKRIHAISTNIVHEGGGVSWMQFENIELVDVDGVEPPVPPKKPPILSHEFRQLLDLVQRSAPPSISNSATEKMACPSIRDFATSVKSSDRGVYIANLHGKRNQPIDEQVTDIFTNLQQILEMQTLALHQITSTLLLLPSMSDFSSVNLIYSKYFSSFPNPPSRVCVAIGEGMPSGLAVLLSVMVDKIAENDKRKALHVQSRSYWALANVGPYSQAIAADGVVSVAGMIGLVPETMKVWNERKTPGETALALQSMIRVGREMHVHGKFGWLGGVGFIVKQADVGTMMDIWNNWFTKSKAHDTDDEESEDSSENESSQQLSYFEKLDEDIIFPIPSTTTSQPPALLLVQVAQLPISAQVEFACLGIDAQFANLQKGLEKDFDHDGHEDIWETTSSYNTFSNGSVNSFSVEIGHHKFCWIVGSSKEDSVPEDIGNLILKMGQPHFDIVNAVLYLSPSLWSSFPAISEWFSNNHIVGITLLPVYGVWWSQQPNLESQQFGIAVRLRGRVPFKPGNDGS